MRLKDSQYINHIVDNIAWWTLCFFFYYEKHWVGFWIILGFNILGEVGKGIMFIQYKKEETEKIIEKIKKENKNAQM